MKILIISALLALASAHAPIYAPHVHVHGVTVGITDAAHPVLSQYHAQDALGQYVYGYATPTSTKSETKTADGVTQGGYSYIDSHGILQTVNYVADPVHGFRVAATNLPVDLPDVAHAKALHIANFNQIAAEHAAARAQHIQAVQVPLPYQHQALPQPVQDLPEVVKARAEHLALFESIKNRDSLIRAQDTASFSAVPVHLNSHIVPAIHKTVPAVAPVVAYSAPIVYSPINVGHYAASSQYHAQDGLGQYTYGYTGPTSSKSETKTADGVTRGGYSYIDANGILQTVHYVADPVHGFRVAATNLPGGHAGH